MGSKFGLEYIYDKRLIEEIEGFELKLNDNLGNFTADMKLKASRLNPDGKSIEFKNWKTGSFNLLNGTQYKNQLKAYIKAGDFEQIFDADKLINGGIIDPDSFVKQKIVDMIKNNADEFWNYPKINALLKNEGINSISDMDINSLFIKRFKAE